MDPVPQQDSPQQGSRVDALATDIVEGRRRLHELPQDVPADEAAEVRRRAIEKLTGAVLDKTGAYALDAEQAASRHCENFVGATQIPLGIVGPLTIRGEYVAPEEDVYVPMATTEGALLASVSRGCRAVRDAGGAVVRVDDVGMTRAPVFRSSGIEE
ncbi:MAG: 3-hydroxy-3-methylglutaryl-CoA reductase, partial [Chloroflexi bacterium]|nr:3-hydroxy-3-methylglutaryl-CoA reductase [Chloroflexota bacterium]